jgi:pimeloyl-ACP methyl ester carboxylesterase
MIPRDFVAVAQLLHEAIGRASKDKPIVVVYHSFGTYIFAQYCQIYKNDRIIGIIDAGGAPIRYYPTVKKFVRDTNAVSLDFLKENLETIF